MCPFFIQEDLGLGSVMQWPDELPLSAVRDVRYIRYGVKPFDVRRLRRPSSCGYSTYNAMDTAYSELETMTQIKLLSLNADAPEPQDRVVRGPSMFLKPRAERVMGPTDVVSFLTGGRHRRYIGVQSRQASSRRSDR